MTPEIVRARLAEAIASMREACDEAERRMSPDRYGDDELLSTAAQVNHIFVWAWANASGDIETAIRNVERMHQAERAKPPGP